MIRALALAFGQLLDPPIARLIGRVILASIALLIGFSIGLSWAISHIVATWASTGMGWLDTTLALAGGVGAWVLGWLMLPFTILMLGGMFIEPVIAAVERRYYPDLPPARPAPLGAQIYSTARLGVLGVVATFALLPFYLAAPGINVAVHLLVNGYLLGRTYYEANALRRLGAIDMDRLWRRHRLGFVTGGAIVAFLSQVPILNLVAPILATAFMTHLFERARREFDGALH